MDTKIYNLDPNVKNENKVLEEKDYKNFHYVISTTGLYPCCYVRVDTKFDNVDDAERLADLVVHGGVTFTGDLTHIPGVKSNHILGTYVGWDYAHLGDFFAGFFQKRPSKGEHAWTMNELRKEVQYCIDVLNGDIVVEPEINEFDDEAVDTLWRDLIEGVD